jgi:U3 small nucleolar RNA-associated protein 25
LLDFCFNDSLIRRVIQIFLVLIHQAIVDKEMCQDVLTPLQSEIISLASYYYDVYYPMRTLSNEAALRVVSDSFMFDWLLTCYICFVVVGPLPFITFDLLKYVQAYCLHAANHVMKTRTRILHHNAKMTNKIDVPDKFRDQGFVRPKVLILVPFKDSGLK